MFLDRLLMLTVHFSIIAVTSKLNQFTCDLRVFARFLAHYRQQFLIFFLEKCFGGSLKSLSGL